MFHFNYPHQYKKLIMIEGHSLNQIVQFDWFINLFVITVDIHGHDFIQK